MTSKPLLRAERATVNAKRSQFAEVIAEIRKDYGDDVISRGSERSTVEAIPSGLLSVDLALGCGGWPRGRIAEVFGPSGHGKTTLLTRAVAMAQSEGLEVVWVDAEFKFSIDWAKGHGVDLEKFIFVQPHYGEEALNIVEKFAVEGVGLIVVDSVAALVPRAEIDGEMEDNMMGVQARMISKAVRKLVRPVARSNSCLLFTNQVREKIGVVYGNPEKTSGGRGLEFGASVRVRVSRKEQIKEGEEKVGIRTQIEVVKNQVAAPFKKAEFDIYGGGCSCHAKGIDIYGDLLDASVERGVIEKSGSWFSFSGERLAQGREASCARLKAEPELAEKVRFAIHKITNKGEPQK